MSQPNYPLMIAFILAGVVAALACNLSPIVTLQSATPPAASSPVTSPGSFSPDLSSTSQGLAELASYRTKLMMDFEGTRNGQPVNGQLEALTEVTRDPAALHQSLKVQTTLTGTAIISGVSEFYRLADKVYIKKGSEDQWFTFTDDAVSPADLGFFAPDRLIVLPVSVAQPPQPELLKELKTQHFSFTERDLSDSNIIFDRAEGDLWLAQSGPYLAQYAISTTLRIVIPDPKAHLFDQGHLTLRYTLTDVNADLSIAPPIDAFTSSAALNNLPRLPDARIVSIFPTFIEYTSAITPIGAALFYRDQLTAEGWTEDQADIFNEKARLTYSKDDETLTVLITPGDERDKIKVLLDLK